MEFSVTNGIVYGIDRAVKASGNPMRTVLDTEPSDDKDYLRAQKLGNARSGEGHDTFLHGIFVHMDVVAPLYWWKEAQRYHWFDFVSSQSTMHRLAKFDITSQCVPETNPEILKIVEKMVKDYLDIPDDSEIKKDEWRKLVASLPSGFCLGATMCTNYQQLKTMYLQRRNHKLKEWHVFCDFCESLPMFVELTGVKKL